MPIVECVPLTKGKTLSLGDTDPITLGRTPAIGCSDNKISRNHALLFLKPDGTVWIKPLHHNPTFYKTKTDQIVSLTRNKEYQLFDNDQFGLLPDGYFYRVSIKAEDEHLENTSTIPKSPVKDNETLTIENREEEQQRPSKDNVTLQTTRTQPDLIFDTSEPASTRTNELNEEKTEKTPPIRRRIRPEEQRTKQIVYDDSDDNEPTAEPTTATFSKGDATTAATTTADPRQRDRCPYGETCYRKNLPHRQEVSHPGDPDWEVKEKETSKSKPDCPYGNECYRKNADHLNEYNHPRKKYIELTTKPRTTKRRASEDDDDDDDGLPNEYDYHDSFIDDEKLDSDTTNDDQASVQSDGDVEWKPEQFSRHLDDTDEYSSDESERELRNHEAAKFLKRSSSSDHGSANKKPRVDDDD